MKETVKQESALTVLTEARKLVEKGWIQGTCARNSDGDSVECQDPTAVSFCAIGAVWRSSEAGGNRLLARVLLENAIEDGVVVWNDVVGRTKEQVLAAFDKAIEKAT